MKIFITTYALTSGIQEVEADLVRGEMASWRTGSYGCTQYAHKPKWHETEAEAVERAKDMREAKLVSLRKSIAKLEKLTFVVKS